MQISLNWLSDYISLNSSPEELAATLTRAGLEVEEIISTATVPQGVVTAKILSREKHPNSDHLSICKVDPGTGEPLQIVCGAPNCDAGNIVPLATIGTTFKDPEGGKDFTIGKGKLRGVESFGMMCSARELGLSSDHDGLMILPADTPLGQSVADMFKGDTVYSLELTQNRPDWLSHWGVARDVYALQGGELKFPAIDLPEAHVSEDFSSLVKVEAPDLCPKYTARVIRGVTVKESPEWMRKRLEAVGIRAINNIVDITNYVMLELGLPLHVFDRALLKEGRIVVRRAAANESITALNGKKYELNPDMLVIADAEKPVAIAGVMGGEYSGVLDSTKDVVIEAAFFNKTSVRMTSAKLNLSSEASHRYERGADIGMVEKASARAAALILELAGGELVSDLVSVAEPQPAQPRILCRYARIRSLLGMDVSDLEISTIFSKLGMEVEPVNAESCYVIPPTYRADVLEEADLAEEVARIHGLDNIPDVPVRAVKCADFSADTFAPVAAVRDALVSTGLYECLGTSMIDEKTALLDYDFTKEDLVAPINPISLDLAIMRPSLLGGMLATVKRNVSRKNTNLALFEIGNCFCKNPEKYPEERGEVVVALTGQRHPERFSKERTELYDFFDLKGLIETFLEERGNPNYTIKPCDDKRFAKGECAELVLDGKRAGVFGRIHASLVKGMRLQAPLYLAVFQLANLMTASRKPVYYRPISQFPSTTRDVAFLAPADMENEKVVTFIKRAKVPNLVDVQLFDIFTNESMNGKKSMAYSLTFRSQERTLTDDEVNKAHEKLRAKLEHGLGVELR